MPHIAYFCNLVFNLSTMQTVKYLATLALICFLYSGSVAQNADVYIMTGNAKEYLGDLNGALVQYDLAVKDDSTYAMAYFNRAYVKRKLNDYEGAIADYTSAITFKPGYQIAYHNRGIVYALLGKNDNACADWKTASDMGYPDAIKLFETYCTTKPDSLKKF
ncbi:MAG: Tetratricopeptide repeat protein [Bacteroidetes bacterium ADurb.Bin408]|nr:MAG: Tetratricopeptide repeat protein [Bacteroidetes bacterium ADurb.Bin408]